MASKSIELHMDKEDILKLRSERANIHSKDWQESVKCSNAKHPRRFLR